MEYILAHGNPHDDSRIPAERETYALLDSLGIEYDRVDHEALFTMEACAAVDAVLGMHICKNLFLQTRTGSAFYLLLMPDDKPFKTKELSAQIGSSRLSFSDAEHMQLLLSLTPGSVSVMGLAFDQEKKVQLLIDRDLLQSEYFGCHPCINTSTLRMRTADILEKFLPAIGHVPQYVTLTGEG